MSGPYVIVNRYAEAAWTSGGGLALWVRREDAEQEASRSRKRLVMDDDECTVMPLAQYLVEYGT